MANETKIRRIKAQEAEIVEKADKKAPKVVKNVKKGPKKGTTTKNVKKNAKASRKLNIKWPNWLVKIGHYFRDSWRELRMTKWPNRKLTWSLTLAVIIFAVIFAALILAFDNLFQWLVELMLNIGGN